METATRPRIVTGYLLAGILLIIGASLVIAAILTPLIYPDWRNTKENR